MQTLEGVWEISKLLTSKNFRIVNSKNFWETEH